MRASFVTLGCKANQYDTERIRSAVLALGFDEAEAPPDAVPSPGAPLADVVVVNTCVVTHEAEQDARRRIRRLHRAHPGARIIVVGCASAVDPEPWRSLPGVSAVLGGHVPDPIAEAVLRVSAGAPGLVPLRDRRKGAQLGGQRRTRGWLGIQDGCDRKCTFCATRVARGAGRSRPMGELVEEAQNLAAWHPEIVLTGIHIGHYGVDRRRRGDGHDASGDALSTLVARLLVTVPDVRFRLGSIEATEVDGPLLDLMATAPRLAPHLHMPLQSGADPVLRRMRRWHSREMYRVRALEIAERVLGARGGVLGLSADVIAGFPGETDADHADTRRLIEELPFTDLHVFPFSPRSGTLAAELARTQAVPAQVVAERARELRELAQAKRRAYLADRIGGFAEVVLEAPRPDGTQLGLTEDHLRLPVRRTSPQGTATDTATDNAPASRTRPVGGRLVRGSVVGGQSGPIVEIEG